MQDSNSGLPEEDCAILEALVLVLTDIQKHLNDPGMTIRDLRMLLEVGCSDGTLGVMELARRLDVAPSVASRALLDLGPRKRTGEVGLQLVRHRLNPTDLKSRAMVLTPKGVATLHRWAKILRRATKA